MAILYGTQSNGETLPVLVDQFGNLLAKGIEGPQGSPGPDGPPGDPGPPGVGVPEPIGENGQYLQVVNGEPAWADGPPDPTAPRVTFENPELLTVCDSSGATITTSDPVAYCKSLTSWMNKDAETLAGFHAPFTDVLDECPALKFEWVNGKDKILKLLYGLTWRASSTTSQVYVMQGLDEVHPGCTLIDPDNPPESWPQTQDEILWKTREVVFQLNDDVGTLNIRQFFTPANKYRDLSYLFRGMAIYDAGSYALQNQIELKREINTLKARIAASAANS